VWNKRWRGKRNIYENSVSNKHFAFILTCCILLCHSKEYICNRQRKNISKSITMLFTLMLGINVNNIVILLLLLHLYYTTYLNSYWVIIRCISVYIVAEFLFKYGSILYSYLTKRLCNHCLIIDNNLWWPSKGQSLLYSTLM
jgi:hypothetical protein